VYGYSLDARVPGCPDFLPGFLALRGNLVAVVLFDRLIRPDSSVTPRRLVVLDSGADSLAIATDDVALESIQNSRIDLEIPWDLADEYAMLASGIVLPLLEESSEGVEIAPSRALVLDVSATFRFVMRSCQNFWYENPPPGYFSPLSGTQ